jgi:hypothetical protein
METIRLDAEICEELGLATGRLDAEVRLTGVSEVDQRDGLVVEVERVQGVVPRVRVEVDRAEANSDARPALRAARGEWPRCTPADRAP